MENDIYTLLGYQTGPKKSASSAKLDLHYDRGSAASAKINTMKIKQKAKELQEMRSIPVINQKSRKLAENMKRERMDLIAKHEARNVPVVEPPPPEPVRISVNIMKTLELAEPPPAEPDLKSMNIHQRTKYWKEQKEKKLEEQRKMKKDQELDGCTFKPKKVDIQDFEIVNKKEDHGRRQSAGIKVQKVEVRTQKEEEKKASGEEFSLAYMLKGLGDEKNKAPAGSKTVQVRPGFLSDLAKPNKK